MNEALFSIHIEDNEESVRSIEVVQRMMRGYLSRRDYSKRLKRMQEKRHGIAQELNDTECNYLKMLQVIKNIYMQPLLKRITEGEPILSKFEYKMIFGEIDTIIGINTVLYEQMHPRMETWSDQSLIGDVFLKCADSLKIYARFFDGYASSIDAIKTTRKSNTAFFNFLADAENHPDCKMQDILLLMMTPTQRIFRYKILLAAMLENTLPDHPDYENLKTAIEKIDQVNSFVNEKKRESEGARRLMEIQASIVGAEDLSIVKQNRQYIAEVECKEQFTGRMKLFLFSDSLLLTIPKGERLVFHQFCGLEGCSVQDSDKSTLIRTPSKIFSFENPSEEEHKFLHTINTARHMLTTKLKSSSTVNPRSMFNTYAYDDKIKPLTMSRSATLSKSRPVLDLKSTFHLEGKKEEEVFKKGKLNKKERPKSWHNKVTNTITISKKK